MAKPNTRPFMVRNVNKDGTVSRMYADPNHCGGRTRKEAETILARFEELNPGTRFTIVDESDYPAKPPGIASVDFRHPAHSLTLGETDQLIALVQTVVSGR